MKKTFSKEKLFDRTPRVFKRDATEVRFLLGGIGTGNFSVNSRGKFLDWEIFNWPSKNTKFPLSFFAIRTENKELEKAGQLNPDTRIIGVGRADWDKAAYTKVVREALETS